MFKRTLQQFLTALFVGVFAILFVVGVSRIRQQRVGEGVQPVGGGPTPTPKQTPVRTPEPTPVQSAPGAPPPARSPVPTQTPVPPPASGTYTGTTYRIPWGDVTVEVKVTGGKLIAVSTPDYPNSPPSQYAHNELISQALAAGSANIQGVSGATYTSIAFSRSLESALAQAHLQ